METKILDLGCGSSKHPNSIGADINSKSEADVICDLNNPNYPYFSCFYSYGDPTHKRCFSILSFDEIAPRRGFKILVKKLFFHKAFRRYKINFLANKFPINYERFWAFIFPGEHLHFELEAIK